MPGIAALVDEELLRERIAPGVEHLDRDRAARHSACGRSSSARSCAFSLARRGEALRGRAPARRARRFSCALSSVERALATRSRSPTHAERLAGQRTRALQRVEHDRDDLADALEIAVARVGEQQRDREQPEEREARERRGAAVEERRRLDGDRAWIDRMSAIARRGQLESSRANALTSDQSDVKIVCSLSMFSSALPQPRTTQVSGSSATITGRPGLLHQQPVDVAQQRAAAGAAPCRARRCRRRAPAACARARSSPPTRCCSADRSALRGSRCDDTVKLRGMPSARLRPFTSISLHFGARETREPIVFLISSAVVSPISMP